MSRVESFGTGSEKHWQETSRPWQESATGPAKGVYGLGFRV